jgi:hypothetical protein
MSVETAPRPPSVLPAKVRRIRRWLRRSGDAGSNMPVARHFLTQEQFQEELVVLGLSDQTFGPKEYASALGKHLGLTVSIDVVPDAAHPLLSRELARKGITGETLYRADLARVHVIVPGSLPPLALVFTLLHELGHLAAGDLFVDPHSARLLSEQTLTHPTKVLGKDRLAQVLPFAQVEHREHEANLRAGYAFVAGCLGSENPYAQRMYDIL